MATRLFLPAGGLSWPAAQIQPVVGSQWNLTEAAPTFLPLARFKTGSAHADFVSVAETSTSVRNVQVGPTFISAPLRAQTIAGTFTLAIKLLESAAGADMSLQCVIRVVNTSGAVVATLYAGHSAALNTTFGNTGQEINTTTTQSRLLTGNLTNYACSAGDRIVVEVGVRAHNTVATSFTATVRYGDKDGGTQISSASASTTDNVPWLEFSQDLVFQATKLYLPSSGSADISPAAGAAWDLTTGFTRRGTDTTVLDSAVTAQTSAADTITTVQNILVAQFVSAALAAQSLDGAANLVLALTESLSAADMSLQVVIRLVDSAGANKFNLYNGHSQALVVSNNFPGGEIGTAVSSRVLHEIPIRPTAAADGDRIVVEVGVRAHNTVTTSYTASLRFGDPLGIDDHTLDGGVASSSPRPFIDLGWDLVFKSVEARVEALGLETAFKATRPEAQVSAIGFEVIYTKTSSVEHWGRSI